MDLMTRDLGFRVAMGCPNYSNRMYIHRHCKDVKSLDMMSPSAP